MITGVVLIAVVFLLDFAAPEANPPQAFSIALVLLGCTLLALAFAARHRCHKAVLAKVSLCVLSTVLLIVLGEFTFRAFRYDFDRLKQPGADLPIYYRPATVHAGEGVLRRPGPAKWSGRPISAFLRIRWGSEGRFYTNEQPLVVEYDAHGFRNSLELHDWDVVVTGDSFVELGYLPHEALFTTLAGQQLGLRVKNLGLSGTGPVSQTFYVKHYGKAASTKDAVLCFFEGNDLHDLSRELRHAESFRRTGRIHEQPGQPSLIRALFEHARLPVRSSPRHDGLRPNAVVIRDGAEWPMTVGVVPPTWERLSQRQQQMVAWAISNWAQTVRSQEMRPWVMVLPDSHRVFHGHLRFLDPNHAFTRWQPGELSPHLGKICSEFRVGFIDAYPALRREVEEGRMPYNLVGDNHFTAEGSRVVAALLAQALRREREP